MNVLGYGLTFIPTLSSGLMKSIYSPATQKLINDLENQLKIIPLRRKLIHNNTNPPELYVKSKTVNFKCLQEYEKSELPECFENFKQRLHQKILQNNKIQRHKQIHTNINNAEQKVIQHLKHNPNLIVGSTDKNLGTFIMTRKEYVALAYKDHLNDETTYKQLTQDEFINNIINTRILIDEFVKQNLIYKCNNTNKQQYIHHGEYIFQNKSTNILLNNTRWKDINKTRQHMFYLLPKIHKHPLKTRPIISCSGGDLENLAKWTSFYLNKLTLQINTVLKDTRSFKQRLHQINNTYLIPPNSIIFSMDAVSLYTNIDTHYAINFLRTNHTHLRYEGPNMNCLCDALEIIMQNNHFKFNNTHFQQINGTAMGTAPAPPYANLVLGLFELIVVLPNLHPQVKLYCRYIDDAFGIIVNEHNQTVEEMSKIYNNLLETMNQQHSKLKWTGEYSTTSLPFLDLNVIINNKTQKITTSTYIKKMNLHLFTPFSSCHPPATYKGIIIGEIIRYRYQCDEDSDFQSMVIKLKGYLQQRQYPLTFINNCIHQAMGKFEKQNRTLTTESPPEKFVLIQNPSKYINIRNSYFIERKRRKLNLSSSNKEDLTQPLQIFIKRIHHPQDITNKTLRDCFHKAFPRSNLSTMVANLIQPNLKHIIAPTDITKKK